MTYPFRLLLFVVALAVSSNLTAQNKRVLTYEGDYGESVSLVPFGSPKDNTFLVYFDSFNHGWDGKVILHWYNDGTRNKKYEIRRKKGLGQRVYQTIVDSGLKTKHNGKWVPVIRVYLKNRKDPVTLRLAARPKLHHDDILHKYRTQKFEVSLEFK